jgi:PAS domain S-box-containing protein
MAQGASYTGKSETRKSAARSLASRDAFRALFERSPIAKIRYDAQGYPKRINDAAAALLGVADASAIAHISLFSTSRIADADKKKLRKGVAIRYEQRYDFDYIKQHGHFSTTSSGVSYLDAHIIPIFTEAHIVKEYVGEFVDITDRKRAEEERASIAKFPEENPNPVLRLTPDGDVLFANEASKMLLQDGSYPSLFDQVCKRAAHAYRSGEVCTSDVKLGTGAFLLTFVPFTGQRYVNVYGADITARKQTEEALHEAAEAVHRLNQELRSANEALRIAYATLEQRVQERTEEIASMNEELRSRNKRLGDEIAERISIAETAKERARRITVLNEIIHVINEAIDRHALFERTLATTIEQLGFDRGLVATVADTRFLDVQCAHNVPPVLIEAARNVSIDDDTYGLTMFRRREIVVIDDVPPDFPSYSFGLRGAFVGIPFVSEGAVIGGVLLNGAKRHFSSEDRELFETIGLEFGIAVSKLQAKEHSEQHTAMLDGARDAIVMSDINDCITYWNHGAERLYGWARDEAIGKPIHSLLNTMFPEPITQIQSTLKDQGRWQGELIHTTQSGATVTVESHMTLQRAPDGTPVATLEINNDITEQRRGEEQLRASSQYSRNLIEASLDPLVTISAEGKITDVNKATEEVTGASRSELIGSDFSNYFTEPKKAKEGYKQVFSDGFVRDYPLAIRHKSGGVTEVLYNATVYRNEAGEVQGIFAAARDITERKRAEEQLRAASLYARSLIEASLDPLVTISPDGKITDVNKATEEVTGRARDELIGSDFCTYFTEPEKARVGYQQVFSDGFVRDYPLALRHKFGQVTDVLYHATTFKNEQGEVQGVFAAARDITDRKRAQEELKRYSDHLEAIIEERTAQLRDAERLAGIGETAAMIGHDLRNPLQGLQYLVDLQKLRFERIPLEERTAQDWENEAKLFDHISEQVFYMNKIVDDLQDYARPITPEREVVPVSTLINGAIASVPPNDRVEIIIDVSDVEVNVDPLLMHRVFANLILNALQAMPQGGTLAITASVLDHAVAIRIQDTGTGIPEEMKGKLFSPLITGKAKGTGLGLAVVKRIVDAHGGKIAFESEAGKGTTFTVRLPTSW